MLNLLYSQMPHKLKIFFFHFFILLLVVEFMKETFPNKAQAQDIPQFFKQMKICQQIWHILYKKIIKYQNWIKLTHHCYHHQQRSNLIYHTFFFHYISYIFKGFYFFTPNAKESLKRRTLIKLCNFLFQFIKATTSREKKPQQYSQTTANEFHYVLHKIIKLCYMFYDLMFVE